jgi:hypothetical protein
MNRTFRFMGALILALLPMLAATAQEPSETDGLILQPVDMSMSTSFVMKHRPFVLPDHLTPAFDFAAVTTDPVTDEEAQASLQHVLELRNLPADRVAAVVAHFADPALIQVIPAPNLRAALLMLSAWNPYQATIDAILDGKNESGHPFEAVDFRPLEFGAAVATLQVAYSTGKPRLLVSDRYQNESPEQLIPVLVHESMHDGVDNSYEEEIIASLLDSLTYAEVLSVDPDIANAGTELAAYNNVQLYALMNSIGRRGAGYVGVETSFDGDVYLGEGLENFDADSIRAGIASDAWYAQLPRGGSQGGAVLAALLGRMTESASLASLDRFSAEAIAVIDQGVGLVLTPRKVRALAADLQLSLVIGEQNTVSPSADLPTIDTLSQRPFIPTDPTLFDLRSMRPNAAPLDEEFARAALRESLVRAGLSSDQVSTVVAQYADSELKALVPDPALRTAVLMLHCSERWSSLLASIVDGSNEHGTPVHVEYRDLPNAVPAVWESQGWRGDPAIWVNSMLIGERPELLATAIAEGALLESAGENSAQSVIAAALSTVLWSEFITADSTLVGSGTWGTITRNRDLLALLDSQPFDPGNPTAADIGLRLATGESDVLPGLPMNPGSFVDYVLNSPRVAAADSAGVGKAPTALAALLQRAGIDQDTDTATVVDQNLLAHVDLGFGKLLPADSAIACATILGLTTAS